MIKLKITTLLIFITLISFAQKENLKWLDIQLSNYEYPFPTSIIKLFVQQQSLEMAYMDIQPENYNGKNVMLLHGKNFNGAYWKTTAEVLLETDFTCTNLCLPT